MILEKLIVENFRQFCGPEEMVFATAKKKNVTLIHAENGFGKTALLNALLWAFYGDKGLSDDFEHPDRILNEAVALEGNPESYASVTVLFKDDTDRYTLTRTLSLKKQRSDSSKTDLCLEVQRDGQTLSLDKPQWRIEALMPRGISPFLFFNGERIDHLAKFSNSAEIKEAIYQMLGLKLMERSIDDLQHHNVRGRLVKEFEENTDEATVSLLKQEQEICAKVAESQKALVVITDEQKAVTQHIAGIDAKLLENKEARDLQGQRATLEESTAILRTKVGEFSKRIETLIAEDGYVLFASGLVARAKEITARLKGENKMPARVMNNWVEELLAIGKCICGCVLKENSDEYNKVKALLTTAGDQNFNNAVASLYSALGSIEGMIEPTKANLLGIAKDRSQFIEYLRKEEEELHRIHQLLGDKDDEEVHDLEKARQDWLLKQQQNDKRFGATEKQIQIDTASLDSLRRQIAASQQQAELAAKAQRRLNALDEMVDLLKSLLEADMIHLREELNEEIDRHFRKIIDRDYWAELSEEFVLRIKKKIGTSSSDEIADVAQSTGQRQITSLVFIASLVALASRRAELPMILKPAEGGDYPMVMDSPFGQLGEEFRSGVAEWIPNLAPQVILFLSSTQYKGKVDEVLTEKSRVGRRYLLAYHGPRKREEAAASIMLNGKRHKQYYESEVERTQIKDMEV